MVTRPPHPHRSESDPVSADLVTEAIELLVQQGPRARARWWIDSREADSTTRKSSDHRRQARQSSACQIETGDAVTLEVLRTYVAGLGGQVEVVAKIGDIQLNDA